MATNAIISTSNLDISKVTFGDFRLNKAGGKAVPIRYNGQKLQIRLPKTAYLGGISAKETENGMNYTLKANMKGCDPMAKDRAGPDAGEFGILYNFLIDLQEQVVHASVANSKKWFGKERKEEVIRDTMKQFIGPSVEMVNGEWTATGKYAPSLRMKIPVYDGKVCMDVISSDRKPVRVETDTLLDIFPKRVEATLVVEPSIYIMGQGFGVTWKVVFAMLHPTSRLTAAQVFADDLDEEVSAPRATEQRSLVATFDEEAEQAGPIEAEAVEYQEEEEAPAPAPVPPPAPVKNRRRVAVA